MVKLGIIFCLLSTVAICSCSTPSNSDLNVINNVEETQQTTYGKFTADDYLKVDGVNVVNQNNENIYLHGTNIGGYSIVETWMSSLRINATHKDHVTMNSILTTRFGEDGCLRFWEEYRKAYLNEEDFAICRNMNMNCLRFPFSYMSVDPSFNNVKSIEGERYNFEILDNFIALASKYHMYTILDLHGAYGSQNGQDHSGQLFDTAAEVDFYTNETNIQKTIDLWKAIAERYKDNPAVAAYDILNEPGEKAGPTGTKHWNVFDRIYKGIRSIDENHIIIFEACWAANNLPQPSQYNWKNVMYSFHEYTSQNNNAEAHLNHFTNLINDVLNQNFNVPIHVGEFICYGLEKAWRDTLQMLNDKHIHWQTWTYKIHRLKNLGKVPGFGILRCFDLDPVYLDDQNETLDSLIEKLHLLKTVKTDDAQLKFSSGTTLERLLREYC